MSKEIRPNFFYIGAPKSASTYIWQIFREHPDIFVPECKNTHYFDQNYSYGHDWFLKHFQGAQNEVRIGEISEWYLFSKPAIDKIKVRYPDAKIIVCLREPLDYIKSLFLQDLTDFKFLSSFEKHTHNLHAFLEIPAVKACVHFYESLMDVYEVFNSDKIYVTFIEDLQEDASSFISGLFAFLEVDANFKPLSLERIVNPTTKARSGLVMFLLFKYVSPVLWRVGLGNFGQKIYMNSFMQRILTRSISPDKKESFFKMTSDEMYQLGVRLHANDQKIEKLIGRSLPKSWYRFQDKSTS